MLSCLTNDENLEWLNHCGKDSLANFRGHGTNERDGWLNWRVAEHDLGYLDL